MGALTSKTKSFQARNWELKEYQTISLSDPFFSPIKVDVRDRKILRILPVVGTEEWINDNTRFFTTISQAAPNTLAFNVEKTYAIENNRITCAQKLYEKSNPQEIAKTISTWAKKSRNLTWIVDETTDSNVLAELKNRSAAPIKIQTATATKHMAIINQPDALSVQKELLTLIKENGSANVALETQLINFHRTDIEQLNPSIISVYELLGIVEGTGLTKISTTIIPPNMLAGRLPKFIKNFYIGSVNQALSFQKSRNAQTQTMETTLISIAPNISFNQQTKKAKIITNGLTTKHNNMSIHLPSSPLHKGAYANLYGQLIQSPAISQRTKLISLIHYAVTKNETL